ncbi:MAG TPA: hypothetical protein VJA21_09265 [Verrucomicrobiae bacterium]
MKVSGLGAILLAGSLLPACGQMTVEVTQDQDQFLEGESLPVAVRIANRSGQTLRLGAAEDWLSFTIESREGPVVSKIGEAPVKGEFDLESSEIATKRVDLVSYFAPMAPGHYAIVATVHVKEWNRDIASPPRYFDVIDGTRLWEQEVGVPTAPGVSNAAPELRKYILQQANYLRSQVRLYLRITDSYGKTYRVFPIGNLVSFSRPEPQVDRFSRLHVLFQNGPTRFSYSSFDLDGTLLARQTYDYVGARPRLRVDDDGAISVFGGVRRTTASDVPPPVFENNLRPLTTNQSAQTKP